MNLRHYIIFLLLPLAYCLWYPQEVTFLSKVFRNMEDALNRTKDEYPLQLQCTLLFGTKEERQESIRRKYFMSKLTIEGSRVRFSDIPDVDFCKGRIVIIELVATDEIIIDKDYDSRGLDVTFVVAAPVWNIIGENRKIILQGRKGRRYGNARRVPGSIKGADGKEGEAGQPGGYFYGLGSNFYWKNPNGGTINSNVTSFPMCYYRTDESFQFFVCPNQRKDLIAGVAETNEPSSDNLSLEIFVNGGDGGIGQHGGNGERGTDGTTFNLDTKLISRNGFVEGFDTTLHMNVDPPENETYFGKGISEVVLGKMPTIGGRGGNGGPGGYGGKPGGVFLVSLSKLDSMFSSQPPPDDCIVYGKEGKEGKKGENGFGNYAEQAGSDVQLSLYFTPNKTIELRNIEYYAHVNPFTSKSLENHSTTMRQTKPITVNKIYTAFLAVEKYTNFTYYHLENSPNGKLQREIFSQLHDNYRSAQRLMQAEG